MRALLLSLGLMLAAPIASAQDLHPSLEPFAMMIGQWEGTAEARTPQGLMTMQQTENVRVELGGNLIVVEGMGRQLDAEGEPGEVVFNAYGILSVDAETGAVYLDAFTKENRHKRVQPTVTEDGFEWSITPEQGPRMHYVMRMDEQGRWTETGEVSLDGGTTWMPFFEMTLERIDE